MAISNSKPNVLPFSALLIIFFALLLNNVNSQSYSPPVRPRYPPLSVPPVPSVRPRLPPFSFPPIPSVRPRFPPFSFPPVAEPTPSPLQEPETTAFGFSFFEPDAQNLSFLEDTTVSAGVIQLTKKDYSGDPLPNSVGLAGYVAPIHLWDKATGNLADFSTSFSFVVNPKGANTSRRWACLLYGIA